MQHDAIAQFAQRKRRDHPGGAGHAKAPGAQSVEHDQLARAERRADGNPKFFHVRGIVAQKPPADVDRLVGSVQQLDAIAARLVRMGQHLVNHHRLGQRHRKDVSLTRRPAELVTDSPCLAQVEVGQSVALVAPRKRKAVAIGQAVPAVFIAKLEDGLVESGCHADCLAAVAQSGVDKRAGDPTRIDAGISRGKRRRVAHHQHPLAGSQTRNTARREIKPHPVDEPQRAGVDRRVAVVEKLDKLEGVIVARVAVGGSGRVEVDLADRKHHRRAEEFGLDQRAPLAAAQHPRRDERAACQQNRRAAVDLGRGVIDRTARKPWVGAVGGEVDRAGRVLAIDFESKARGHLAAVLVERRGLHAAAVGIKAVAAKLT